MGKWRRNRSLARRWQRGHLIKRYGCVCNICGKAIGSMTEITFDHLMPASKGGTDDIENLRLAHLHCNLLKADMTPKEFEAFQKGGDLVE